MEEYTIKRKIGDGAQGVVYEVEHNTSKTAYAMKVICCADQEQVNLALKEIKVLLQLRHPSIVSYVDFFLIFNNAKLRHEFAKQSERSETPGTRQRPQGKNDDSGSLQLCSLSNSEINLGSVEGRKGASQQGRDCGVSTTLLNRQDNNATAAAAAHWLGKEEIAVCLVMELCRNGDMQGLVRDARQQWMQTGNHPITEAQALSWLEQGAAALQFIHEKGFLHRDLKPTNIFFDEYKDIKIGDFGLAATVGLGRNSAVGTPYYLAPERMLQQRYDGKVDVWGLGVVLLELLTLREQPINSMVLENPKAADKVVEQITAMKFSDKLAGLVRSMLQRQPGDRPEPLAILQRLASITTTSPHLGMSATLFAGMSCPKMPEALCDVCEVEAATVMCASCRAAFCAGCDRARHKHHTRQGHDRTSLSSLVNGLSGTASSPSSATTPQQQLTLSFSRGPSPANTSDQTRSNMQNASLFPSGNASRTLLRDRDMNGKTFNRFQLALPGNSMSMSEFSVSQSVLARRDNSGNNNNSNSNGVSDTVLRVPQDVASLAQALQLVESMPHIRKIVVASNTTHTVPLVLTSRLPDSLKLVGESPPPMLEVADSPFALHCQSGKGTVENFIVRHVGRCRSKLRELNTNSEPAPSSSSPSPQAKKPSRPTAVSITGGEWRLHKCRISCVEGSGVTIGGGKHAQQQQTSRRSPVTQAQGARPPPCPGSPRAGHNDDDDDDESAGEGASRPSLEPVITKCTFIDVTTAGVVLMEKSRGLYENNTFSGCGFAAFLLKKESTPRIRANHITDGAEAGIFCQDASGVIEYNVIAQNAGCGIVVKGASAAPVVRKNRVLSNAQAGVFCCDRAAPFVSDNEIRRNGKAGVLVKTSAAPKITKNVIEEGKEAGIYVFDKGAGIIEENRIRMNQNAGLLVTTGGNPHVIHNTLTKNAYEGVWVCKSGGGTFCDNDLRGNTKGPKDVETDSRVTWVGNLEE
jgi:parallel beta-helix repeat protein